MMKAILTGHTRGLGAAIAQELLSRGIPILGIARHGNEALAGQFPALLQQAEADLADAAALSRWLAGEALQRYLAGSKSVLLINNAGTVQPIGSLETQDAMQVAQAISLNVTAPLMLAGAVVSASRDAAVRDVRILHVSSGAARSAYAGWSVYCATKAALDHHARAVALDRSPGVHICSLAPGVLDTDMQAEIRAMPQKRFPMRGKFDGLKRDGLLIDPSDCAKRLVNFLLSRQFGQSPVADLRELGA
jgi:hypothetical protein